ncbi:FadR/GntR family transcriptional regulator [Lysinibacter cavernae]|uniref:DNA-binding FadR family transcriptional regulator n=1 Tax=Lysinibacter cavernae TaxID=1640652 RepID=A0A7X5R3H9_9MICO|nr:FCD domain-containing protein [Lysinibacter cavernae]NIH55004.1 DNA-binding FadR family transcriptional regulator [Lysinibacter cavernae]
MARKSLVSVVADELLDRIVAGELGPNSVVPTEQDLMAQHDVSRMTVREALSALQAQNIIRVERGRGTFVNPVHDWKALEPAMRATEATLSDEVAAKQLIDLRRMIENGAIGLSALNRSQTDIEELDLLLEEMIDAHERDNLDDFVRADIAMHDLWFRSARNVFVSVLLNPLDRVLYTRRRDASSMSAVQSSVISHHSSILEAVRRRDPEAARKAMDEHMNQATAVVTELLENRDVIVG